MSHVTKWLGHWTNGPACDWGVEAWSAWEAARKIGERYTGDSCDWEELPDGSHRRFVIVSELLADDPGAGVRFEVRARRQTIFTAHCVGDEGKS